MYTLPARRRCHTGDRNTVLRTIERTRPVDEQHRIEPGDDARKDHAETTDPACDDAHDSWSPWVQGTTSTLGSPIDTPGGADDEGAAPTVDQILSLMLGWCS
jgi:hypothetical protein